MTSLTLSSCLKVQILFTKLLWKQLVLSSHILIEASLTNRPFYCRVKRSADLYHATKAPANASFDIFAQDPPIFSCCIVITSVLGFNTDHNTTATRTPSRKEVELQHQQHRTTGGMEYWPWWLNAFSASGNSVSHTPTHAQFTLTLTPWQP